MKQFYLRYKKTARFVLVWFLISLAFAIGSVALIFYTAGYKFNYKTFKIQKTGMIYLSSEPRDVEVYLDGKLKKLKTPTRFTFLLPGDYSVTIKKDDYVTWEKRIKVESGLVSKQDEIILFRKNLDLTSFDSDVVSEFKLAPSRKTAAFLNPGGLWGINLDTKDKWLVYSKKENENLSLVGFSTNSQKILIRSGSDFWVLPVEQKTARDQEIIKLSSILPSTFSQVTWQPQNNERLFGLSSGILYLIDLARLNIKIVDQEVVTYSSSLDSLYFFKVGKAGYELKKANLDGNNLFLLKDLIKTPPAKIYASFDNQLVFLDENKDLYLFSQNELLSLGSGVLDAFWGRDEGGFLNFSSFSRLLFHTTHEIWWYDKEEKTPQLVTRISSPVDKAIFYSDQSHIIYASSSRLFITEEDGKNTIDLTSINLPELGLRDRSSKIFLANEDGLAEITIR